MTKPTMPIEAVDNRDGTYTIPDPRCGDWLIYDTGQGWTTANPADKSWDTLRFATAADVAHAILGDPTNCRLYDGRTIGQVYG